MSFLQNCQTANVSAEGKNNTSQLAPFGTLLVRCCFCGTKDTRTRRGRATGHRSPASLKLISWRPSGGKRKQPCNIAHTFQSAPSQSELSLPVFGRTQTRVTLMHGAAVLQGPGKVCPHLGDFPISKSHRVAVKKKERKKKWNADDFVTGTFHVPPCLYGAQSTHNAQLRQEFRYVKLCIYVWWRITALI